MLVRIVKMSFEASKIEVFLKNFNAHKEAIRNFEGCSFLELYQDRNKKHIFFTYSYWNSEEDLNAYRNSALFKQVWSKTKLYFNAKPEAWSVNKVATLN
jgi:autoinducer 2-degrading protein